MVAKFNAEEWAKVPVLSEKDYRLSVLAAKAMDQGIDVTGLNADEIATLLDPKPEVEAEPEPVINCCTVWHEAFGVILEDEDEAAELLMQALDLMTPSPLKEKARQVLQVYLETVESGSELLTIGDSGEWSEEELAEYCDSCVLAGIAAEKDDQAAQFKEFEWSINMADRLEKENTVKEIKTVVEQAFPLAVQIAKMTNKELDAELRRLDVPDRSKARTKSAKQALLSSFIVAEEESVGVSCHRCGNHFVPDEEDEKKFLASGKPFDPTDWICVDCRAEEANLWQLQSDGQVEEPVVDDESVSLERLASEWWTPAAVAARLGTVADPARADAKAYVFAPSLCSFVFKLGEKLFSQRSFHPASWAAAEWQVRIAMNDERTGHPDLSQFSS